MPAPPAHPCSPAANLQAAIALLAALQALGLRRLVLCPGSRSAPLAVAAGVLEHCGLKLYTSIDERSAGFLALGLGRADGVPVAVVTTSGSAVANLLPAVVEADHGAVPLLLLTADRPARLKGCGANQTVNQEAFLAPSCRWFGAGDPRGLAAMPPAAMAALAQRAWAASLGMPVGPVHLNLPFEEPLHASASDIEALLAQPAAAAVQPNAAPAALQVAAPPAQAGSLLDPDRPGVVVAGPWRAPAAQLQPFAEALVRWQQRSGWPVLADGLSGLRGWPGLQVVQGYDLLLADGHGFPAAAQLLRLGSMPASRRLQQWITASAGLQLLISEGEPRNLDATGTASLQFSGGLASWLAALPDPLGSGRVPASNQAWLEQWVQADQRLQQHLDRCLLAKEASAVSSTPCSEPALARALSRCLPAGELLMLANSSPVRDWESFAAADAPHRPVVGFRGASGIDGTLSIAAGLALGHGRATLLCGDLALLHDANGWLWRDQLAACGARLTVVLVDNTGGGIFEQLPIRTGPPLDFERLFAMPQRLDHSALAAGYGVEARSIEALDQLADGLAWAARQPMALLHVRTDRRGDAALRQQCRRTMATIHQGFDGGNTLS
ncbi:2-succinyl-5-enolpyruvyl-6-hydroxy-3-cyclohexene-1-carboxylic-acid synthase [Vulcanococcus sp.]|uniref:2-succinyl-5-enolpyruvyl-6-hydroxy-3- cyclohexene-1-carboxylic-acid synthase n=1 Tax=Vulcanococcus sp. TaxID=2856995 RepID=UPI0037D9F8DB